MYTTLVNNNDYQIDLHNDIDETGTVGLWDMAADIIDTVKNSKEDDTLQQKVYDILVEFRKNAMALGMHEFNGITNNKALSWLNIYETVRDTFETVSMPENLTTKEKTDFLLDMIQNIGFKASTDYDEKKNPHLDFEVWYADDSYGLRIFFGEDESGKVRLYKDFYGYMYGDDSIYEDLNTDMLQSMLH